MNTLSSGLNPNSHEFTEEKRVKLVKVASYQSRHSDIYVIAINDVIVQTFLESGKENPFEGADFSDTFFLVDAPESIAYEMATRLANALGESWNRGDSQSIGLSDFSAYVNENRLEDVEAPHISPFAVADWVDRFHDLPQTSPKPNEAISTLALRPTDTGGKYLPGSETLLAEVLAREDIYAASAFKYKDLQQAAQYILRRSLTHLEAKELVDKLRQHIKTWNITFKQQMLYTVSLPTNPLNLDLPGTTEPVLEIKATEDKWMPGYNLGQHEDVFAIFLVTEIMCARILEDAGKPVTKGNLERLKQYSLTQAKQLTSGSFQVIEAQLGNALVY